MEANPYGLEASDSIFLKAEDVPSQVYFWRFFMQNSPDWLPRSYDGVLVMASDWMGIIPSKVTAWGIPADAVSKLGSLTTAATDALAVARNKPTRTTAVGRKSGYAAN
jgi:hypothetical protein